MNKESSAMILIDGFRSILKKNIYIKCIALLLIISVGGCNKYQNAMVNSQHQGGDPNELVATPFGKVTRSNTHYLPPSNSLRLTKNGHLLRVSKSNGEVLEDFGIVKSPTKNDDSGISNRNPNIISGEVAYAYWKNTANPGTVNSIITNFSSSWVVPYVPSTNSGQTIFIFNAISDGATSGSHSMIAALQYGVSAAGGGNYWSQCTWWVIGSSVLFGELLPSPPGTGDNNIVTNTGDLVTGVLTGEDSGGGTASYSGETTIDYGVDGFFADWWSNYLNYTWVGINAIGITKSTDYPSNLDIAFKNISIKTATSNTPSVSWTAVNGTGQATVVSNSSSSGEVDLYFQCPKSQSVNATWTNYTKTLSWSPVPSATSYYIYVLNSPQGPGYNYTTSSTSINFFSAMGMGATPGAYQVTMVPIYSCGTGNGTTFNFNYCSNNLSAIDPNTITWDDSTQKLSWSPVSGATSYEIVVNTSPQGGGMWLYTSSTSVTNLFSAVSPPLNNTPGTYTLWMAPIYSCGYGPSTTFQFTH